MSAVTPRKGRAGLCKDQPVQGVDFSSDTQVSSRRPKQSICDLPANAGEIIAAAVSQALDVLEGRIV
jgi:hypothetical protein